MPPLAEPIACPIYSEEVLSDTDAVPSAGAAPISRTCCIELLEAKPRPHTATPAAMIAKLPAPSAQMPAPVASKPIKSSDVR